MAGQAIPLQVAPQPQLAGPPANGGSVQQHILRTLSQQTAPQGWQSSVQPTLRANIVHQIFSSLRLLQSNFDLQYALNAALVFEGKTFAESSDRNMYEGSCKRKLEEICQMRAKQSATMQQQMNQQLNMPQHMQNMAQAMAQSQGQGPGQFHQVIPNAQQQQQQQMMQLQGIPMQQQQQHQQPQPPGRQQPHMAMGQRPTNISQGQPSAPQPVGQQPNQYTPTPEENQYIGQIAQQMFQQTPPQRLESIRNNLRTISAEQRENLNRQGLDPMAVFFRSQAMKKFLELKRQHAGAQPGSAPQSTAMANGSRPSTNRPQGHMPGPQQSFEPQFDQIVGQQQDGLRSQEAGQVVVPASNLQAHMDQRNAARAGVQQQMGMQAGANRSLQNGNANPQAFWNPQSGQRNMSAGSGVNGGNPAANFPNGNQAQNVLQGQPGGLDNQITRTPSQTPGMPNLNKAAAPPGQTPNMWSQRTPQIGQGKPPGASMTTQSMQPNERPEATQQRPPSLQNMSVQMQQQLANLPEEQRRIFLMNMQRRQQMAQQQHIAQLQKAQMQSQGGMGTSQPAKKAANAPFPMSSQPSQPGLPAGLNVAQMQQAMSQQGNGPQPSVPQQSYALGGPSRQQPGPNQLPPQRSNQVGSMINHPAPLSKEQVRQMDQRVFPAEMLSRQSQLAQIPKEIRTWGQLKEFVAKNSSSLPPNTLTKLENLQSMQFRSQQQEPRPPQQGTLQTGPLQQQAPFAQMVSQPTVQAPVAAPRPANMINIPPPTFEEIQSVRLQLPPNLKGASDAHVSGLIMRSRQKNHAKHMQAQAEAEARQLAGQPKQIPASAGQANVGLQQTASQTRSPEQQTQKPSGQAKSTQGNRNLPANKQSQKTLKRNSPDDVVEVPNPSLVHASGALHGQSTPQAKVPQPAALTQVENPTTSSNQKDQIMEGQNARPQEGTQISQEEHDRRDVRLKQLMTEVGRNQPLRRPVPMTDQTRVQLGQKLREFGPMIQRMESSLPHFFRANPDENVARQLIQMRQMIKSQFRDAQFNLVDQLTITPAELEAAYSRIKQYFVYVMKIYRRPNNASQIGEQPRAQRPSQAATGNQEKAQLSAANLKEQQSLLQAQRAAAMQKAHPSHSSRAPPAPTSDKPPFPLGPQSPHGTPHAYGPTTLTADQLILPVPKRRKSSHQPSAGSTPNPAGQEVKSSPLAIKLATPEVAKTTIPQMSFKCGVSTCELGQKGFATQAELTQHNADEHEPKEEVIEDPLEFALESMRVALGLDENGKSKPVKETLEAPKMKASLSTQSQAAIKQEVSTPMTRTNTQTGPSPASNFLKTPQTVSGMKSPAPDAKPSVQEGKGRTGNGPWDPSRENVPALPDPWAGSSISAEDITSAWSSLADMQSMPFTKIQMGLTPSSTLSSSNDKSEKNSPRPSDISENDGVKINIEVDKEDNDDWIPGEWFENCLNSEIEALDFGQDEGLAGDMEWDFFGDAPDAVMSETGRKTGGKGRKKDEQDIISEEWLKVYAPERLAGRKGR
ncbi:MAG: hypothetical protein Q9219_007262 [cf. Caloplaca sp. 3 TL-2023]